MRQLLKSMQTSVSSSNSIVSLLKRMLIQYWGFSWQIKAYLMIIGSGLTGIQKLKV